MKKIKFCLNSIQKDLLDSFNKTGQITEDEFDAICEKYSPNEEQFLNIDKFLKKNNIEISENFKASYYEKNKLAAYSTNNALNMYFSDISKYPLLTAEEEIELSKRIEKDNDGEAIEKLVNSNLRLVTSIAKKYRLSNNSGLSYEDLIQYGNMGLMKAAIKFDYKKGCRFSTYASFWIKQSVIRARSIYGNSIKIPVYMNDMLCKIKTTRSKLLGKLEREPTLEEIAEVLGEDYSAKKIEKILSYDAPIISLEAKRSKDKDGKFEDQLGTDDVHSSLLEFHLDDIEYALNKLEARERKFLELRYGLNNETPHTLEQVGKCGNITRERARQIIVKATHKMRVILDEDTEGNDDKL
jgi:RNA polymerase primary sigma factor